MFRHTQILSWSCPIRPLQHLSCLSEQASAAGWLGGRNVKERRHEDMDGSGREQNMSMGAVICVTQMSSSTSGCDNYHPTNNSSPSSLSKTIQPNCHQHPQDTTKQASDLVSTYLDCLSNATGPQSNRRRFWDFCQLSLSRTFLHHMQHFVRPACLSTCMPWISNLHRRLQLPNVLFHQCRAAHQVAPSVENAWRDCLSPVNEDRCRQSLEPNLKSYQVEKSSKGANLSQGKNQARWASVLVSLCSVEGEPAILFTLRSRTLTGRHKGDVSFAGGKSDPSDGDVVTTALREAREELGITVATEQVWGVLKCLRDVTGMMVAPVLANLGPLEELTFKPNPAEVEEIFTISLSHLCNPKNRGYTHFRTGSKYGYTLPVFRNGKHRVWGLTAVALDHTLKLIVPR